MTDVDLHFFSLLAQWSIGVNRLAKNSYFFLDQVASSSRAPLFTFSHVVTLSGEDLSR